MQPTIVSVGPEAGSRRHPLLFVHGAWHGAWCWEDFQRWFAQLGWETHAVDLRGHGDAPIDRSLRRTRIRHYADDVAAAIESLDRPPILVAHSMGALAAQKCLEKITLPGAVLVTPIPLGGVWRTTFRVIRRHPIKFLKANLFLDLGPLVAGERALKHPGQQQKLARESVESRHADAGEREEQHEEAQKRHLPGHAAEEANLSGVVPLVEHADDQEQRPGR